MDGNRCLAFAHSRARVRTERRRRVQVDNAEHTRRGRRDAAARPVSTPFPPLRDRTLPQRAPHTRRDNIVTRTCLARPADWRS